MFDAEGLENGYVRRDAITDATLEGYVKRFGGELTKEDIFYYVYALLQSPEYKQRFASDLQKMIPRIPMAPDFWAFSKAGRRLADWHLNYETVEPYPLEGLTAEGLSTSQLAVVKMRFDKTRGVEDRSTILYNSHIMLRGVPLEAYEYEVNGKSAIEWVMDRYQIRTDKDSGILNDPNSWSDDPRYILDLVGRIVRVSPDTRKTVSALPSIG